MQKKQFFLLFLFLISFAGCKKNDSTAENLAPDCSDTTGLLPEKDTPGRVAVHGRAFLPDGRPAIGIDVALGEEKELIVDLDYIISYKTPVKTDQNGEFKFDRPASSADSIRYLLVFDRDGSYRAIQPVLIEYNCSTPEYAGFYLDKNRSSQVVVTTCPATVIRFAGIQKNLYESIRIQGSIYSTCNSEKRATIELLNTKASITAPSAKINVLRGEDHTFTIFGLKNGVWSEETIKIKADKAFVEIPFEY
jgi:hypothetical protein